MQPIVIRLAAAVAPARPSADDEMIKGAPARPAAVRLRKSRLVILVRFTIGFP